MEDSNAKMSMPPPMSPVGKRDGDARSNFTSPQNQPLPKHLKTDNSKRQALPDLWKSCVSSLEECLLEINVKFTASFADSQSRDDQKLQTITECEMDSKQIHDVCEEQIKNLHSSVLDLASSFAIEK